MANAYHSKDLLNKALSFAGEFSDGTSTFAEKALAFLNTNYLNILSGSNEFDIDFGAPWSWARRSTPRVLILLPAYATGTVTVTNGLTTGTFSAAPALSQVDRFLKVNDRPSFYRIVAHTAATTGFTLDTAYLEDSGSGLSFNCIPIKWDLGSQILRLVEPLRCFAQLSLQEPGIKLNEEGKIYGVEPTTLRQRYPLHTMLPGVPTEFATLLTDESHWYVEMNRYVTTSTKVDFDCIDFPTPLEDSDSSIPVIPIEHRIVLAYLTAHSLCVDKGMDTKAAYWLQIGKSKLKAMIKSDRKNTTLAGKNKGALLARQEELRIPRRLFPPLDR